ncbi:unnamed protein product [Euphydryas editha]|uniref:Transposase n=1 Tax=Euphydryas editha TaxID=104508 RepID=A0AAU9TJ53_EUPED|nr:unnamed protein product [Euphydryas editha]
MDTVSKIQRELSGVTLSTVQQVLQRFYETVSNLRRPGTGRKRCMTVRQDRYMVLTILRNHFLTAVEVKNHHLRAGRINLSIVSIRQRLAKENLKPLKPVNRFRNEKWITYFI